MSEWHIQREKRMIQGMKEGQRQMKAKKGPIWERWKQGMAPMTQQLKDKKGPYWENYLRKMRAFVEREEKKLQVKLRKKGRDFL